ncbi:hypothetical protein RR46_10535 [Papilio xuthus]|uniref:Uncharacterized protein n=1 Tax=Papilio xuthus TaxID=66420 RepID=A0A194PQ64_PAPXU|nr:hypothetical protein RR46_10535 [Papilio xuthus]
MPPAALTYHFYKPLTCPPRGIKCSRFNLKKKTWFKSTSLYKTKSIDIVYQSNGYRVSVAATAMHVLGASAVVRA